MRRTRAKPLPSPDFAWDPDNGGWAACRRPYRRGGIRLELASLGAKRVVHNYGHGGAGISLSWGCAEVVRRMVRSLGDPSATGPVAILGAGVMGLTSARLLKDAGYSVALYADRFIDLTSDKAGGQWAPSLIDHSDPVTGGWNFKDVLEAAYRTHGLRIGSAYGVSRRVNYATGVAHGLQLAVDMKVLDKPRKVRLPFEHLNGSGLAYKTLLVEPPVFLGRLRRDLRAEGVQFVTRPFASAADVAQLAERVVVNCTGYGAGGLFGDPAVEPCKGLLVRLRPQAGLDWLYSGHGYVFPRSDCVVVGGSADVQDDEDKDPGRLAQIRAVAEALFAGYSLPAAAFDGSIIRDK